MKRIFVAGLLCATPVAGFAQQNDSANQQHTGAHTMQHMQHSGQMTQGAMMGMQSSMQEPGQGAFAAIGEIVAALEADPATDWTKVNIAALREHLRDMNVVMINAIAIGSDVPGGQRFEVTGAEDVAPSIRRMVLAHSSVMQGENGWAYAAEATPDGAVMTVTVPEGDLAKLKALGFFGVLTAGMHHQAHHWMMATGKDPH